MAHRLLLAASFGLAIGVTDATAQRDLPLTPAAAGDRLATPATVELDRLARRYAQDTLLTPPARAIPPCPAPRPTLWQRLFTPAAPREPRFMLDGSIRLEPATRCTPAPARTGKR